MSYICQNPECGAGIDRSKWRYKPKYCGTSCWHRHQEILRGQCARPGCDNPIPPKRGANKKYCSESCYLAVKAIPRKQCAREDCKNMTRRADALYCSAVCRKLCVPLAELGNAAQAAVKAQTGQIPRYEKRARAVARSNRENPRRARK